ncbi:DUF2169 domain-containing protein [Archangium lansingense]|uniref:DUF2169 domain-containing protein n=1 Tax=Archangium lansingense TaxID=2995310 RepID=UPI003B760C0E
MPQPIADLVRKGFVNLTPFAADMFLLQDEHGADVLTLVVKATFVLQAKGALAPLQPSPPVSAEPVFHGAPGASSLKYETEAVFTNGGNGRRAAGPRPCAKRSRDRGRGLAAARTPP